MKKILAIILLAFWGNTFITKADNSYYSSANQVKISAVNSSDNWVKLFNTGNTPVDLAGWVLYDGSDSHELFITLSDIISDNEDNSLILAPQSNVTIIGKNDTDFVLNNRGGEVKLYSGPIEMEGVLQDKINYPKTTPGESYVIIPESQSGNSIEVLDSGEIAEPNNENKENTAPAGKEGKNLEEQRVKPDMDYKIPESSLSRNRIIRINDADQNDSGKSGGSREAEQESKKDGRSDNVSNSSLSAYKFGSIESEKNVDNDNTMTKQSDNEVAFTASSKIEKSPYAWFYRLWGSWFFWRIILPLLGLWVILYSTAYFVRKKYFA